MRALLVNCWSDDNKGDSAIVSGLIDLLAHGDHHLEVRQMSAIADGRADHDRFVSRHRAFRESVVSPLPVELGSYFKRRRLLRLGHLVRSLVLLVFPALANLFGARCRAAYQAMNGCDWVLSKGGHIFVTNKASSRYGGLLSLYFNAFPILWAIRMRKKTAVVGQSIGGFSDVLHCKTIAWILRKVEVVATREHQSAQLCCKIGVPGVDVMWDTAFALNKGEFPATLQHLNDVPFAAFTIRQWEFPDSKEGKPLYEAYLHAIEAAARHLLARGMKVVFLPQVTGPTALEDDRKAISMLQVRLSLEGIEYRLDDFDPATLKAIYGKARLVVGTRFHSVILSLSAGTPAVAISYYGFKTTGIMEMLGLGHLVVDIGSVDPDKLVHRIEQVIDTEEKLRSSLRERMAGVRRELEEYVSSRIR